MATVISDYYVLVKVLLHYNEPLWTITRKLERKLSGKDTLKGLEQLIMEKSDDIQILHATDNIQVELIPLSEEDTVITVYKKGVDTPDIYYINNMTLYASSCGSLQEKVQEEPMKFESIEQLKNFILL